MPFSKCVRHRSNGGSPPGTSGSGNSEGYYAAKTTSGSSHSSNGGGISGVANRVGKATTPPHGSPTKPGSGEGNTPTGWVSPNHKDDQSPPKSPFEAERLKSIAGGGGGRHKKAPTPTGSSRRPSFELAPATLRRTSLGSHSSLSSLALGTHEASRTSREGSQHGARAYADHAPMRQNNSFSDLENARHHDSSGTSVSRASSILSYNSSVLSAGGGGSRAKPPRVNADSNLPGAPGRFLAWLPRTPTLEGTLEKLRSDSLMGSTIRMLGLSSRGWKMRHFVLYDNHLFWGRGFSRMYGYGTVLSAYASPEDGETCFVLELVTHPKFSLRRGGIDSLDYWQRLYGLCCSTHGYSRRLLRAGTVLDRDRWITSAMTGVPHVHGGAHSDPVSPAEAMLLTQEKSVFSSLAQDGKRVDGVVEDGVGAADDDGGDNFDEDEDGSDPFAATPNTVRRRARRRQEARERSGLWTPRDASGSEAQAAAAWEHAAAVLAAAEVAAAREEALESVRRKKRTSSLSKKNGSGSQKSDDGFVSASSENGGSSERSQSDVTVIPRPVPPVSGSGKPLPAARGSALRKTSSLAKKKGSELGLFGLVGLGDIFGVGGGGDGNTTGGAIAGDTSANGSRKVKFRDETRDDAATETETHQNAGGTGLASTVEYAPTPTRRNPGGVGKTSAKLAPFSGSADGDEPADGDEVDIDPHPAAQRALRHAAGRWVIPPEELKVGRRVGAGSFGEVFTADWNGTEVALKQMHNKNVTGESVEEFAGEIRMMQGMRHPNVVLFLGAVINGPILNIVCELMPYGSLHSLLHGASQNGVELSTNGRLREQMARDCARGMSYLHSRSPPVVHNDLKPANLLVDAHWTVKVCDFGMSRLKHSHALGSHSPGGTPEWMAPEALRNDHTDESSDVYSFAVILWELMTLKYPWEELSSPVQIVVQVAFLHRRPKLPTWVPSNAVQLLQRCWHKDPDERPGFPEILELLKNGMPLAWVDHPASDSPRSLIAAKEKARTAGTTGLTQPSDAKGQPPHHNRNASLSFDEALASESANAGAAGGDSSSGNDNSSSLFRSPSPSVEVAAGGFVSLKGLRPIKTPAVSVKHKTNALGPNHQTESASSSCSSDTDDAPVAQGHSLAPQPVLSPSPLPTPPGANSGFNSGVVSVKPRMANLSVNVSAVASPKVLTHSMSAAGALKMPGLSPIKIKSTVSSR